MEHVLGAEVAREGRQLHHDPVRIGEVDGPNEDAGMHPTRHAHFAVVVIDHHRKRRNARRLEALETGLQIRLVHREGDVVHRADGGLGVGGKRPNRGDPRRGRRRLGPPEEGQARAAPAVEEEVLAAVGQRHGLHEGHVQHLGVELHRLAHVATDQGQMIDAVDFHLGFLPAAELIPMMEEVQRAVTSATRVPVGRRPSECGRPS